jgi:hypothetical protein
LLTLQVLAVAKFGRLQVWVLSKVGLLVSVEQLQRFKLVTQRLQTRKLLSVAEASALHPLVLLQVTLPQVVLLPQFQALTGVYQHPVVQLAQLILAGALHKVFCSASQALTVWILTVLVLLLLMLP